MKPESIQLPHTDGKLVLLKDSFDLKAPKAEHDDVHGLCSDENLLPLQYSSGSKDIEDFAVSILRDLKVQNKSKLLVTSLAEIRFQPMARMNHCSSFTCINSRSHELMLGNFLVLTCQHIFHTRTARLPSFFLKKKEMKKKLPRFIGDHRASLA